jgi:hypothetical protein
VTNQKKTTDYLYFTSRDKIGSVSFEIDEETGEVTPEFPFVNGFAERARERPKGPKVVSRVPQAGPALLFDREQLLWRQFDYLCAVDTNTRELGGHQVSITGVVQATKRYCASSTGVTTLAWAWSTPEVYEFTDTALPIREKLGWLLAIERMQQAAVCDRYPRVGLIVDSDMSRHESINARREKIIAKTLPEGFTLVYASSDTGRNELQNKLITAADRLAKQIFEKFGPSWSLPTNAYRHSMGLYKTMRILVGRNAVPFEDV